MTTQSSHESQFANPLACDAPTDHVSRRQVLTSTPSPDSRMDYIVTLKGSILGENGTPWAEAAVHYVPDRDILDPASFGAYLDVLGNCRRSGLEAVAAAILEDVSNEAVPRWLQVSLMAVKSAHPRIERHRVLIEDRQPKWDNPALLERLG